MKIVPPVVVVGPMFAGALLVILNPLLRRRWIIDILAIMTAGVMTALCVWLILASRHAPIVYWFGGWTPVKEFPLGINFFIDPPAAGLAAFVGLLVTLALVFSWHYFESIGTLYHTLMLIFQGAMTGFCLTGDLFNLFVFFELMSVAAYALTAYKIEETGPLQGALNFSVMNTIGGVTLLMGIAVLYAQTGSLNMAAIGQRLVSSQTDTLLVSAALGLLLVGLFVKGAVVPFHFWLPDAHAVAPTPVSVLFSGVMVELGLYGAARVYWTVFHDALSAREDHLRLVLLAMGAVCAIWGGVLCFMQRHLKRLLAFSTVSHGGVILMGIAMFKPAALTGVFVYLFGHGCVKAALFFCVGIYLHRLGSVDEDELHGRGKHLMLTGWAFLLGGLALAGMPPFGTFLGKALMEGEAAKLGHPWFDAVAVLASALTGGAVLRAGICIYRGWGKPHGPSASAPTRGIEERETVSKTKRTPAIMLTPVILLLALSLVVGLLPGLVRETQTASLNFQNSALYHSAVLKNQSLTTARYAQDIPPEAISYGLGFLSTVLALLLAVLALGTFHVLGRVRGFLLLITHLPIHGLRTLHSGYVGDYVAWFALGTVVLLGMLMIGITR